MNQYLYQDKWLYCDISLSRATRHCLYLSARACNIYSVHNVDHTHLIFSLISGCSSEIIKYSLDFADKLQIMATLKMFSLVGFKLAKINPN